MRAKPLAVLLAGYDPELSNYLLQGFSYGFHIGFQGERPGECPTNLPSALQLPAVVQAKLDKELQFGRLSGPSQAPPFGSRTVTSPIGLVEKHSVPGDFRLIHHLSFPPGTSVNDGIPRDCATVSYASVDDAVRMILRLGRGCYLAKTDVKSAFRIVPVHPDDYHLLGFKWNSQYFFDKCLPFGLASSCKIFETFSSALEWAAKLKLGVKELEHILDDFLFGDLTEDECNAGLQHFLACCMELGVPIAAEKTFPAAQRIVFSGLLFDTNALMVLLPDDKLLKCRQAIHAMQGRRSTTLRQLQSLIGLLSYCTQAVVPGRAFLRRLINLTIGVTRPQHHISLNSGARADLAAWNLFLTHFQGRVMMLPSVWETSATLALATDSSGVGFGAVLGDSWFYGTWPPSWQGLNITFLELYPIVASLGVWASSLTNRRILFFTDNLALVHIINKTTSRDPQIMVLVRHLVALAMQHNIHFKAKHIPGKHNVLADHLSRLQVQCFRQLAPLAQPYPTLLPQDLRPERFCLD